MRWGRRIAAVGLVLVLCMMMPVDGLAGLTIVTPGPSATVTAKPTATPSPAPTARGAFIAQEEATPEPTVEALPVADILSGALSALVSDAPVSLRFQYAKTRDAAVNLRADASADAKAVTVLYGPGVPVIITGTRTNDAGEEWYSIAYGQHTGFIRSDLLTILTLAEYEALTVPSATARASEGENPVVVSGMYIGNRKTLKFHHPGCKTLPEPQNQVGLSSRSIAVEAGYTPCGNCKP
ncbi:SH3 domain-containing protein [Eubacteriales bacterium OttesenSCG-928-A19]|nr:SH3 domain-containing protein [Eubacteriales bacterium OttesenSCG-928-A19]